jgi:phospholipase C
MTSFTERSTPAPAARYLAAILLALLPVASACSGTPATPDAAADDALSPADTAADSAADTASPLDAPDAAPARDVAVDAPTVSNIEHVVLIVQENHTFDTYFGRYCTAPAGSNPSCTDGPACCEAAPAHEPSGASPIALDDAANAGYDPNHTQSCERDEMNGGAMDRYVRGASCSDARNFAIATDAVMTTYHGYAQRYALADRYFQSIIGQTSANDMYLAVAQKQFTDNDYGPATLGQHCILPRSTVLYSGRTTIADLVLDAGWRFGAYPEGYRAMVQATLCPAPPSDCPFGLPTTPCDYDPSDIPFQYYRQFADNPAYIHDAQDFLADLDRGALPNFAYIKPVGYHNEHPGYGTRISDGAHYVDAIVQRILASPAASSTLILLTWDEGGGFFDHVAPPGESAVDHEANGTRVPLLAIGRFARRNHVSHVPLEHSSIVRFLEWNFTGRTGQLGARDAQVHNLGSLLDPAQTGLPVPE